MAIIRVQFRDPVPTIGEGWSREKQNGKSEILEKGSWLLISLKGGGSAKGQRIRVPMTNVVAITEDDVAEAVK